MSEAPDTTAPAIPEAAPSPEAPAAPEATAAPETPPEPASSESVRDAAFSRALAALDAQGETETPAEEPTEEPAAEAEPATTEEPEAEPEEAPAEEPPVVTSDAFAALEAERAAFAQERAAFEAAKQAAQADPRLAAVELLPKDPRKALEALGTSYNEITALMLGKKAPEAEAEPEETNPALEKIAALEAKLAEQEYARNMEMATKHVHSTLTSMGEEDGNTDRWEMLTNEPAWEREVVEFIDTKWKQAGSPRDENGNPVGALRPEEAADKLEAYLFEQATRYEASKVRKHYGAHSAPQPTPEPGQQATPAEPPAATVPPVDSLSTAHASSAASVTDTSDPAACRARAIAALESR